MANINPATFDANGMSIPATIGKMTGTVVPAYSGKRVYLAGPMSGYEDYNFPAFNSASKFLRSKGDFVFSPAENDYLLYGKDFLDHPERASFAKCMEDDLRWICRYAEAIALLPGWERSTGVKVEKALSDALKLPAYVLRPVTYVYSNADGLKVVEQSWEYEVR